jgi:hypothetical protein
MEYLRYSESFARSRRQQVSLLLLLKAWVAQRWMALGGSQEEGHV